MGIDSAGPIRRGSVKRLCGARGLLEAIADGIGEASGLGQRTQDQGDATVIEGPEAGEEGGGKGFRVIPSSPGLQNGFSGDGPAGWKHDSYHGKRGVRQGVLEGEFRAFDEHQAGPGSVVANSYAGGWQRLRMWLERGAVGEIDLDLDAGCGGELRGGDGTGAVEEHGGLGGIEDGGFDTDGGGAGVEYGVDAAVEVGEDVGGGCGAGVAEEIGTGGGDGQAGGEEQSLRDGVGGDADADQFPACGDGVGDGGQARKEQGERAGPEGLGERPDAGSELGGEA